jgi:hypothetical protein
MLDTLEYPGGAFRISDGPRAVLAAHTMLRGKEEVFVCTCVCVYIYICIYIYICMYVCMYVCMYAYLHVCDV